MTVLNWVRAKAQQIPEPKIEPQKAVVIMDEMWHYLKKRPINSGFSALMTHLQEKL